MLTLCIHEAETPLAKARIEDVAARAGTSPVTVSRALRSPAKVAPETRARIAEAIAALEYIPNMAASSLASRRSGIAAMLVPTIGNSVFAETVRGVSDALAGTGLQLLIGDYAYSDQGERDLMRALIGRQPEALVVIGVIRDPELRTLLKRLDVPVVETWDLTDTPVDSVVGFSNPGAGAAIATHFLTRGRRRLAFVGGTDDRAQARARGFAQAARDEGAAPPHIEHSQGISIAAGRGALARILAAAPATDAVFFATDVLAVGGLLECQSRGIEIPTQLAIAGLGDLEIGRELTPALPTVQIPAYAMGHRAGELALARRAGHNPGPAIVDLGFTIVARQSS